MTSSDQWRNTIKHTRYGLGFAGYNCSILEIEKYLAYSIMKENYVIKVYKGNVKV